MSQEFFESVERRVEEDVLAGEVGIEKTVGRTVVCRYVGIVSLIVARSIEVEGSIESLSVVVENAGGLAASHCNLSRATS